MDFMRSGAFSTPASQCNVTGHRPVPGGDSRLWILVASGSLLVFLADLFLVVSGAIVTSDTRLDLQLHRDFGTATDPFFSVVSNLAAGVLGSAIILAIVVGFLLARQFLPALLIVVATGGAAILDGLFKVLVRRPRPELFHHAVRAPGYSFPSGHSTNTFAFFAAIAFLLVWARVPRLLVVVVFVVGVAATVLVGLSRITLGVHYPTDVVGGYAISAAWCIGVLAVLPARLTRFAPDPGDLSPNKGSVGY